MAGFYQLFNKLQTWQTGVHSSQPRDKTSCPQATAKEIYIWEVTEVDLGPLLIIFRGHTLTWGLINKELW